MDALHISERRDVESKGFRERLTRNAILFVHKRLTKADREAIKILDEQLGPGGYRLNRSDNDPYDVRPRLEAGRGSVYRGVDRIGSLFESIRTTFA
jgi:hypothetical protein